MKILSIVALVTLFLPGAASAQGRPEWIGKVYETIKLKEPTWKVGDRLVNDQGASYAESFRLTKGGRTGAVQITSYSILTNPIETFGGLVIAHDNITKHTKKVKLTGLGDEGYVWAGRSPGDFVEVMFRRGSTFVTVFLPGRANAERFARHVASHIP